LTTTNGMLATEEESIYGHSDHARSTSEIAKSGHS